VKVVHERGHVNSGDPVRALDSRWRNRSEFRALGTDYAG
jgi:hypothetical protein